MTDMQARPTTEVSAVVLSSMDFVMERLFRRLEGLTADEYLWEPTADAWSVRPGADDVPTIDGAGVREIDPAPVTTIAWRLWHIAIDCLDDYARRFAGDDSDASPIWTLEPDEAVGVLRDKWGTYREVVSGKDWWAQLGDDWEFWSQHAVADMVMHASNELVHHAAEIALLRDLYGRTQ